MHTVKPIDRDIIIKAAKETGRIATMEDHNIIGGIGSAVSEVLAEAGMGVTFKRFGLRGFSNGYGTYKQVKEMNGIGITHITDEIKKWFL